MKRMLINATQPEELRVALVDGQQLNNLDIEVPSKAQKKANIYKGKITRVEPSLEAAFVEFGSERHGFLPFKEISRQYFKTKESSDGGRLSIKDAISEGQEVIVQVEKEERGNKGAALTTFISLAGRYLVLMPNNPRAGGISRRVEGDERAELREALSTLDIPTGMGLIVRTAGVGRVAEELQWDLDYLMKAWTAIEKAADENRAPLLIYQESNLIVRAIRDYFAEDLNEVLIDDPDVYEQAREFVALVMPENLRKIKLYEDPVPLFNRYQIESRIETAFQHDVRLPSGGAIVIDHTEALVAVDINSARATKGSDIEETALNTNLEAADEVARQLRLRDLGGLIVIDFIDMSPAKNQREVENRLREALKRDRARVQIGRISRFGLLEMSRQRLRPSLGESHLAVCPRCTGQGVVRSTESLALSILRLIEEEAMKEKTGKVMVRVPLQVGTFLLNEKRDALHALEQRNHISVVMIPDPNVESPHHDIQRVRSDDDEHEVHSTVSYELVENTEQVPEFVTAAAAPKVQEPVVKSVAPPSPAPIVEAPPAVVPLPEEGLFKRLWTTLFGGGPASSPTTITSDNGDSQRPSTRRGSEARSADNSRGNSRRRSSRRGSNKRDEQRDDQGQGERGGNRKRGNDTKDKPRRDANARTDETEEQQSKPPAAAKDERGKDANAPQSERGRRDRSRRKPRADNAGDQEVVEKTNDAASEDDENKRGDGRGKPASQPSTTDSNSIEAHAATEVDGNVAAPEADGDEAEQPKRSRSRRGRRGGRGRRKSSSADGDATQSEADADESTEESTEQLADSALSANEVSDGDNDAVDPDALTEIHPRRQREQTTADDAGQQADNAASAQASADATHDAPKNESSSGRSRRGRGRSGSRRGSAEVGNDKPQAAEASVDATPTTGSPADASTASSSDSSASSSSEASVSEATTENRSDVDGVASKSELSRPSESSADVVPAAVQTAAPESKPSEPAAAQTSVVTNESVSSPESALAAVASTKPSVTETIAATDTAAAAASKDVQSTTSGAGSETIPITDAQPPKSATEPTAKSPAAASSPQSDAQAGAAAPATSTAGAAKKPSVATSPPASSGESATAERESKASDGSSTSPESSVTTTPASAETATAPEAKSAQAPANDTRATDAPKADDDAAKT